MATYTAVRRSKHATLVASTVDTVPFSSKPKTIEVRNLDSTAVIFFRTDGTAPTVKPSPEHTDGNEPTQLAAPAALTYKWPALTSLEGTPAYNVGRAYAAFAADLDNGTHTVPDFADAVQRHEVIAAIERSAVSGKRVTAQPTGPSRASSIFSSSMVS
jgi:predicted dehydrogenase